MESVLSLPSTLASANDDEYPDEPLDWIDGAQHSGRKRAPCVPTETYPGEFVWPISGRFDVTVMRGSREYILRTSQGRLRWADEMIERYLRRFHRGVLFDAEIESVTLPLMQRVFKRYWMHNNTAAAVERGWRYFTREHVALINGKKRWISPDRAKMLQMVQAQIKKWGGPIPLPG